MRHRLFKYYNRRQWAEDFLDGRIMFQPLSYFQYCEDAARGDQDEGTSLFRPNDGLKVHNLTQGTRVTLARTFESSVKANEIFAFCVSRIFHRKLISDFQAVACIQINKIAALCRRIEEALPSAATFKARRVDYYRQSEPPNPRWALPDVIATSKLSDWAHQEEYRFLFSLTDALDSQNVMLRLIERKEAARPPLVDGFLVEVGNLRGICSECDLVEAALD